MGAFTGSDGAVVLDSMIDHVVFVAIKNGEHAAEGYMIANFELNVSSKVPLSSVKELIMMSVQNHA